MNHMKKINRIVAYGCSYTVGDEIMDHDVLGMTFEECNDIKQKYLNAGGVASAWDGWKTGWKDALKLGIMPPPKQFKIDYRTDELFGCSEPKLNVNLQIKGYQTKLYITGGGYIPGGWLDGSEKCKMISVDATTLKNLESFLFKRNENTARKGWNHFYRMRNDGATWKNEIIFGQMRNDGTSLKKLESYLVRNEDTAEKGWNHF